jgi:hypothetical protein
MQRIALILAELTVDKPTLIENVTLAMPYIARKF